MCNNLKNELAGLLTPLALIHSLPEIKRRSVCFLSASLHNEPSGAL